MKYFCNVPYFATATAVIGLALIVVMVTLGANMDLSASDQLLDLIITGQVAGLVFLVASDLIRKTLTLQARIVKLEEQIAHLKPPVTL